MKRNTDLARTILLKIETKSIPAGPAAAYLELSDHSKQEVDYHVRMLQMAGFVVAGPESMEVGNSIVAVLELTWEGHELLDDIRDPEIWRRTKARAKDVGGVGVGLLWEIAKAEIKAKLGLP